MCVTRIQPTSVCQEKKTLHKTCSVTKFSYDNDKRTRQAAASNPHQLSDEKMTYGTTLFSGDYFALGSFAMTPANNNNNNTRVHNILKFALEETSQDQEQGKSAFQLEQPQWTVRPAAASSSFFGCSAANPFQSSSGRGVNCLGAALASECAIMSNLPTTAIHFSTDDDEDDDECRLDEDEWTESTGSSSISSACFLHENSAADQFSDESETKGCSSPSLSSSFSVSVPIKCSITYHQGPTTTNASQKRTTLSVSSSLPRVQVRPGVMAAFLGAHETWNCIRGQDNDDNGSDAYDCYQFVTCANTSCRAHLCCARQAQYVLCPDCCHMSQTTNELSSSSTTAAGEILAGLGFTFSDIRNWEQKRSN